MLCYIAFQARIEQMGTDVAAFISSLRYEMTEIGMLEFDTTTKELSNGIIPLNSDADRDELIKVIPTVANGGTCIGCGLNAAIDVSIIRSFTNLYFSAAVFVK